MSSLKKAIRTAHAPLNLRKIRYLRTRVFSTGQTYLPMAQIMTPQLVPYHLRLLVLLLVLLAALLVLPNPLERSSKQNRCC
jgi:hypothetical protein